MWWPTSWPFSASSWCWWWAVDRSSKELTAAFASTLRTAGWTVTSPDGGRMAHKDGVTLFVEPLTESLKEEEVIGFTGILISVDDDPEQ